MIGAAKGTSYWQSGWTLSCCTEQARKIGMSISFTRGVVFRMDRGCCSVPSSSCCICRLPCRCDNKGPTITLVSRKETQNIFGAFTSQPWRTPEQCMGVEDPDAFLFRLARQGGEFAPARLLAKRGEHQVQHAARLGPTFGRKYPGFFSYGWHDLCFFEASGW